MAVNLSWHFFFFFCQRALHISVEIELWLQTVIPQEDILHQTELQHVAVAMYPTIKR